MLRTPDLALGGLRQSEWSTPETRRGGRGENSLADNKYPQKGSTQASDERARVVRGLVQVGRRGGSVNLAQANQPCKHFVSLKTLVIDMTHGVPRNATTTREYRHRGCGTFAEGEVT